MTSPAATPPIRTTPGAWRQRALAALAVLLLGGVLLWRILGPISGPPQAIAALAQAGAEIQDRPLLQAEREFALEAHPATGGGLAPLATALGDGEDVVLLHFWASWCPPCIEELPRLTRLVQAMQGQRFRLVAVGYDDAWAEADAVLKRTTGHERPAGITWLRDPAGQDGDPASMLRTRMGTDQLPETYVVYRGRVLARFIAAQDWTSPRILDALKVLARGEAEAR